MPRSTLEALAERWVPGEGPAEVSPLSAGLVNESYRVARGGRRYSLRVAAPVVRDLGLDRRWECKVLGLAAAAGLAPTLHHCDPARGIVTADWIDGRSWAPGEERLAANIDALAGLLRRVHALPIPRPARIMNPAAWIAHYATASARHGHGLPSADLRIAAASQLDALAAVQTVEPVLCHGDLHRLNIVVGDRTVLLDWEFAHVSDPFWDLAGWIANNDWAEDAAEHLLASYLDRPPRAEERTRVRLLAWLYDYVCLAWQVLHSRRSGTASRDAAVRAQNQRTSVSAPSADSAARAHCLGLRLKRASRSRAGEVPAHYPANAYPRAGINGEFNGEDDRGGS